MQYVMRRVTADMTAPLLEGYEAAKAASSLIFSKSGLRVAILALSKGLRMSGELVHDGVPTLHHSRLKFLPVNLALLRLGKHLTFFFPRYDASPVHQGP